MTEAEFAARAAQLGLALTEEDLTELHRGWMGLQPQLARLREAPLERPAHEFTVPRDA